MGHIGILGTTVPNISCSCFDINSLLFPYFLRTIIVVAYCWVPFRSKFCFLNSPHQSEHGFLLVPEQKSGHRARARALTPEVVLGHRPGHGHLSEQAFVSSRACVSGSRAFLLFSHASLRSKSPKWRQALNGRWKKSLLYWMHAARKTSIFSEHFRGVSLR